ncbi:MAG: class II aldolase/adducin family protein [Candidatus Methanomethylicaceae archaeon]
MSYDESEIREQLVKCMKTLHGRGLITGIGGNASIRMEGTNEVLITPSALYKGELKPDDIVKIDLEGNVLDGVFKPSIEWHFHAAIYNRRLDVNAVIHTHSPMTTGLALAGKKIEPITLESAVMLADVPILEFRYPGTKELGEIVANNIMGHRAVIMQNHGVIAVGYDLIEALTTIEVLEEISTMTFVASHFGGAKLIPADQIEMIKKLYKI